MVNRIRWQSCPRAVLTRAHNCQSGVRLWISSPGYPTPAKPGVCDICCALHFCLPLVWSRSGEWFWLCSSAVWVWTSESPLGIVGFPQSNTVRAFESWTSPLGQEWQLLPPGLLCFPLWPYVVSEWTAVEERRSPLLFACGSPAPPRIPAALWVWGS